jgi:hypothetical protein
VQEINCSFTGGIMPNKTPMDTQVGGGHYKDMAIQPFEYCMKNKMNAGQSSAIKYISRYPFKHGKEDLEKAIHILQMTIQLEYPE